ncbi:MAG TPA: hypothetical protein PLP83_11595 [Candidatus Aminicenantes bacterium]|nr:hypothetical protein [Candidatus Aminicenantes bacterium]
MSQPLGLGGVIVGTIVGLLIGIPALLIRLKLNARNMPAGERRQAVLASIREMKAQGLSYEERKRRLMDQGLRPDVANQLLAEAERG